MSNPTEEINVKYQDYVRERTMKEQKHFIQGVPDYAFASDYSLRQKIRNMPGIYPFFKAATNYMVPYYKQIYNANYIRVTVRQYPKLYEIVGHCAETLGIGQPSLFVMNSMEGSGYTINAGAYATEDTDPLIVITTAAVERLTDEELMATIGHECGHIQNNHSIYSYAATYLASIPAYTLSGKFQNLVTAALQVALNAWSRAAEVTCDRAGTICCGSEQPTLTLQAKLMSGGVMSQTEYDIEEVMRQYDDIGSAAQINELLLGDHPSSVRRMLAIREFVKSEVYYGWHPEQKMPGMKLYSKEELDARCNRLVSTLEKERRGRNG